MVTKLTGFGCLSTKATLPTSFDPLAWINFLTLTKALSHIFRAPVIVITGVSFIRAINPGLCNKELIGILGDKNHAWYPKIIKSYEASFTSKGASSDTTSKTQSGITLKKPSAVHGNV